MSSNMHLPSFSLQELLYIIGAFALVLLVLVAIAAVARRKRFAADTAADAPPSHEAKPLLSEWERRVLFELRQSVPTGWHICPQVRIADFLVLSGGDDKARLAADNRLRQRSVDFLLIDDTAFPRAVIELDDRTHTRRDRQRRDEQNDEAYRQARIPVRHLRPGRDPEWPLLLRELGVVEDERIVSMAPTAMTAMQGASGARVVPSKKAEV